MGVILKGEKFKEFLFVFGTNTFLMLFFFSFAKINWNYDNLYDLKPYIGVLGLIVIIGYIERAQNVLSKRSYYWISICAVLFSLILHIALTS